MAEAEGVGSTTIKAGPECSSPWLVVTGFVEERRQQVIAAAGWDRQEIESLTLYELTVKAAREFQGS